MLWMLGLVMVFVVHRVIVFVFCIVLFCFCEVLLCMLLV